MKNLISSFNLEGWRKSYWSLLSLVAFCHLLAIMTLSWQGALPRPPLRPKKIQVNLLTPSQQAPARAMALSEAPACVTPQQAPGAPAPSAPKSLQPKAPPPKASAAKKPTASEKIVQQEPKPKKSVKRIPQPPAAKAPSPAAALPQHKQALAVLQQSQQTIAKRPPLTSKSKPRVLAPTPLQLHIEEPSAPKEDFTSTKSSSQQELYLQTLGQILQSHLSPPDEGVVKVEVTLNPAGALLSWKIIESSSSKNRAYFNAHLPLLTFPPLTSAYPNATDKTLCLTFNSKKLSL